MTDNKAGARTAVTLCGSIRRGSHNEILRRHVSQKLREAGAVVTDLDLADYDMPLFNEDLEPDRNPEAAVRLAEHVRSADIVFIATPEYNGGLPPLTVNTITWLSRQKPGGVFRNAVFGIGGVSSGKYGTIWALAHLRDTLSKIGGLVAPGLLGIGPAEGAFDESGRPVEPSIRNKIDQLVTDLMSIRRR